MNGVGRLRGVGFRRHGRARQDPQYHAIAQATDRLRLQRHQVAYRAKIAARLGYPVVLKIVSDDILHKTEAGGVIVGLKNAAAVRRGFNQLIESAKSYRADAAVRGVQVQQMLDGGREVMVGAVTDPSFGKMVAFGLGGVLVELLGDAVFRIQPLTDRDAAAMVRSIRGAKLLDGYRNLPPGDVGAVEQTLLRLSTLVATLPEIAELDLNPVKVLEPGKGVAVVDGRVRVRHLAEDEAPALADLPSVPTKRP